MKLIIYGAIVLIVISLIVIIVFLLPKRKKSKNGGAILDDFSKYKDEPFKGDIKTSSLTTLLNGTDWKKVSSENDDFKTGVLTDQMIEEDNNKLKDLLLTEETDEEYKTEVLTEEKEEPTPIDKEIEETPKQIIVNEIIGVDISNESFEEKELQDLLIRKANISNMKFKDSKLINPIFSFTNFVNSSFKYAEVICGYVINTEFNNCDFSKCEFKKTRFDHVSFINCTFDKRTDLASASFEDTYVIKGESKILLTRKSIEEIVEEKL